MKPVLIRQHLLSAPSGTLAEWLGLRGLDYVIDRSWHGTLPDPEDYAFVRPPSACSTRSSHA